MTLFWIEVLVLQGSIDLGVDALQEGPQCILYVHPAQRHAMFVARNGFLDYYMYMSKCINLCTTSGEALTCGEKM